jgi:hypothetical protein
LRTVTGTSISMRIIQFNRVICKCAFELIKRELRTVITWQSNNFESMLFR